MLKTKRLMSIVLAVLLCVSMLTGIVLPAAAADATAEDPYAKINATTVDGKLYPADNVYFVDNAIDNANEPAEGAEVTYTYGDGVKWGDGKTYTLKYLVNLFPSWNNENKGGGPKKLMIDLSAKWAADPANNKGEAVFVFAPGSYGSSTGETALTAAAADPTPDQLFSVVLLGPQAGKSPVSKDLSTEEKAEAVQNGRGNTANEFAFTSTFHFPHHAKTYMDGFMLYNIGKLYAGYNYTDMTMVNMYYTTTSDKSPSGNSFLAVGSGGNNTKFHLKDSYFNVEHPFANTANTALNGNDILIEGCVFAKGKLSTLHEYNQTHHFQYKPTKKASASANFYGELATKPTFVFRNNAIVDWESCHFLRFYPADTTYTDYGTGKSVQLDIIDNKVFDTAQYAAGGDFIYWQAMTTEAHLNSTTLNVIGNLFSFSKDWNAIKGTTEMKVIDFLTDGEKHALAGKDMPHYTIKGNTFIADYRGTSTHIVKRAVMSIDMSGNLFMDNDGNIMPFRGTATGYANEYGNCAAVHSDIYASDEMSGGIRELMTVKEIENGVVCYNHILLNERSGFAGIAGRVQASLTVLLKRNDDGSAIEYDADTLLKFDNDKVKFEGIYSDKACTQKVETVTQDNVTGKYAKATYAAGNTKLTVVYHLNTPTTYRIVDPTNAYLTTGYKFNGITYKPGETAADGVTATAAKRADGTTGFYEFINNSHKDANGATVPSAYDGIYNPSVNYGKSGIEGLNMTTIVVLTPGTHYFGDNKTSGTQGMGKSVCFVGPQFGVSPYDKDLAKTGKLANGRSFDPTKEAVVVGRFDPADGNYSFVFDGLAFTGNSLAISATNGGSGAGLLQQTHVIKNCVFNNTSGNLMNFSNNMTTGKIDKDILIADCAYDGTGVTNHAKGEMIFARAGKFAMRDFAVINDSAEEQRLVYTGLVNPEYIRVNRLRTHNDFDNITFYNSNRNVVLATLRDSNTLAANFENYPNGFELNITNCHVEGGTGYFFGAQAGGKETAGIACDTKFIKLNATNNYFYRPSSASNIIAHYHEGAGTSRNVYSDDSVFADNIIINGDAAGFTTNAYGAALNIDENFFGYSKNGTVVPSYIKDSAKGVSKDKYEYYLNPEMTLKNTDLQLANNGYEEIKRGIFVGYNQAEIIAVGEKPAVAKFFKAPAGATIEGIYTDAALTTPATGNVDDGTYYVLVKHTATGITCVTAASVSFSDIWGRNGLAPVDDETFVDLTTQAKYHERLGGRPHSMIFIAPDWKEFAYKDAALTQKVADDATLLEAAAGTTNVGDNREMLVGTEFYAKMPTTGIVYKLTYGVTAADLYHADTSRASTIVAFPGEYKNGSAYNSKTLYSAEGTNNWQVGIGTPWLQEAEYSSILFLGPQAGVSAADTEKGTSGSRSLDPKTEAIFNGRGFYIMNNILGDGDELIFDGIAGTAGIQFYDIYGNANFTDQKNNIVTFSFKNVLLDKTTGSIFNLRSEKSSVGADATKNLAKLSTNINIDGSYINSVATGWQFLGYVQADNIHVNNSVLLNNTVDHATTDSTGFYINPTTGTNFPKKIKLSYICENSYISSSSYIFGIYFNGTSGLNATTREGIEVRFENNKMVDCGIDAPGKNDSRDPLYIAFSPTAENVEITDFIFKNNTVTATTYPVDSIDGNLIQTGYGNFRTVDISGNVITGYGVTTKIIYGMYNTVDVSNNVFFDLNGNPITPKLGTVQQKVDAYLNADMTAKISDFNVKSGMAQIGKLTWTNSAVSVYDEATASAKATIEYADGMTVDSIKSGIKFASDNVTVTSVVDNNGGAIAINDTLTVTATHALTGKGINYTVTVVGLLPGATLLEDTAYAGRNYFDPAVSTLSAGSVVAREVEIDGVNTLVQFTIGENLFGDFNEIPVINKQRDIYLFPINYSGFNFGVAEERNVMNYLHGAKEGISGVADTNSDGVPDAKNPARVDKSKETVLTSWISTGYHADVTVDGVTLDPGFYMNNTSGNWGADLFTNNIKLLNSVTDTVLLQSRGASDQIIGAKGTHRLNVEVGNTYIVCSDESLGGNIITVRSPEHVNLYNNVLISGKKMNVLYYAPVQTWGKTDTFAFRHEVDVVGNYIDGSISLTELPTTAKLPIDVNVKGNLFEIGKDATSISVSAMYTDANTYLDAANSKFNIEGNTFTAKPGVYTGSYINFGASSNAADLTVVLKDNTFVRGSNFGANYAISNYGKMVFDASDNNVFDGFKYNTGDHTYIAPMIFRNTGYTTILSDGAKTSYVKYNGKTYAANVASNTFGIADLFSDKAIVDADAKTVTEYVADATTNKYIFNVDEGMNVKATIGNTTYYNAIPLTNGTATATVQLTKINGEAVGEAYTVTFVVFCDHTTCYENVTPDKKVDATCSDGYANYTCPVNGDKFTVILTGDGQHTYDNGVDTIPATCASEGLRTFTCTRCVTVDGAVAVSYTEVIPVADHTAAADAEWDIILLENCKDDGEEVKYCQWCGEICERQVRKSTGAHGFVPTIVTPATCTTEGTVNYYCAGCKVSHDEAIPVLGHDYKAETTLEPTCITDGVMTYTCANECGSSYTEAIKSNGKHVYESTITTAATCHSDGVMTFDCGNCDESYTEVIPATGAHDTKAVVTKEATCTEDGEMTYSCQADGCDYTYTEAIPNLGGHDWNPWVLGKESTCAVLGYDVRVCSVCGEQETRERPAADHVWDDEYTVDVQPTGSVQGIKSRHCLICKDARTDLVNMGYCLHENYTGEKVITRETYCLEPGLIVDICADCGDECNEQQIPVLPHDLVYTGTISETTCTTDGLEGYHCNLCKQDYNEVIPAYGHNNGVWKTVTAPTCTTEGVAEQRCLTCDTLQGTRAVAATNHANGYEWITTSEATCTNDGELSYSCVDCGYVSATKVIARKGHQDVHVDTIPATCTEDGLRTYECLICGIPLPDQVVPATGHKAGKWETVKPATTNGAGLKVKKCTACGEVVEEQAIEQIINSGACHPFTDVAKKAWYHESVDFVYGSGLMNGTTKTQFSPDATATRGMFVTILGRLSGVDASKYNNAYFEDVKDGSYYFGYIEWARVNGIVNGTGNFIFQPDRAITRQEMCKIIITYADFEEIALENKNAKVTFTDNAKIASWARTYVYAAQRAGIVSGDAAGTFRPTDTAKRAEIATLIMNFYNNYVK